MYRWSVPRSFGPVIVAAACGGACAAVPAPSAGASTLGQRIVADPVPGWKAAPALASSFKQQFTQGLTSELSSSGINATVAAKAWQPSPGSSKEVGVLLVTFSASGVKQSVLSQIPLVAGKDTASQFCQGSSGKKPARMTTVAGVPHSHLAICSPTADGTRTAAATFAKGTLLALVVATGFSTSGLRTVATTQYRAL
ncbi:MAG TPA: hypothetical protein VHB02_11150 [Acidimicrobiales bacterium]|nr:hypothetical protein [Acidimicrobiales bacterium]